MLAGVAQLVEQLICNHQVGGSSPFTGSNKHRSKKASVTMPFVLWCAVGVPSRYTVPFLR